LDLGLDATSDLADAVACADLLILSVPVGAMAPLLANAIAAGLPEKCLITDVGSVKRLPHDALRPIVSAAGYDFIGSHPMAGGEKGGIAQARADLFLNAACLLTNDENVGAEKCQLLEEFWQGLGCRTSWCSSAEHDAMVARISHFPHMLACIGATVGLKNPELASFGGGGLRDTTRVAAGNPDMWAEILLENRDCLLENLHESLDEMKTVMQFLESADFGALQSWLCRAKARRDVMNPPA
jgi:prephenate dehydrogenase